MRPSDHIGWVFSGPEEFVALARGFLAEGAEHGERLMFVAADPDPSAMEGIVDTVAHKGVQVASIAEVYGTSGLVDAARQRATFAEVLSGALADGYTGIRVAADNSPLVVDPERLAAWERWECVADHFMSENPVIGLCAFDRGRVDIDRLRHLATLHPLLSASSPTPQYRLFVDDGALRIEGLIDTSTVNEVGHALEVLPPQTPVVINSDKASLMSAIVIVGLDRLARAGRQVTVEGTPGTVAQARWDTAPATTHLRFVEAERHAEAQCA
jgi:hypothetical protein